MKIIIEVNAEGEVKVSGLEDPKSPFKDINANIAAMGVLEIAKAALLAHRWGIDLRDPNQTEPFAEKKGGTIDND